MKNVSVKANDVIFKRGDVADSMYLIKTGLVGVYADYCNKGRTQIAILGKGKCFGEMGIIDNAPRSADIIALDDCELIEITAADFDSFVKENTDDVIGIMKNMSERLRRTNADLEKAIVAVNRFLETNTDVKEGSFSKVKSLIANTLKLLGLSGKEKEPKTTYTVGEVLFEQGDVGTHMFQILTGEVSIVSDFGKATQAEMAVLSKGAIIGEMAVVSEERRSATVVAKTDVTCVTVANGKLKSFLTSHPEEAVKILRNMSAKLRATTEKYIETLASISEFVDKERGQMGLYVGGDEFITYADFYDSMAMSDVPMFNGVYDPMPFFYFK